MFPPQPPPPAPKKRTKGEDQEEEEEEEDNPRSEEQSPTPEPAQENVEEEEEQEEEELAESLGSGAAPLEGEDAGEGDTGVSLDETDHAKNIEEKAEEEVDTPSFSYKPSTAEEDSYEARQAERRRKREQRKRELEALSDNTKPSAVETPAETPAETTAVSSPPPPKENGTDSAPATNGTADLDSYEARKEARRKAREERKKAAARIGEDRPKALSYKEKKALEARKNAKDSRKQWENREEDSGSK